MKSIKSKIVVFAVIATLLPSGGLGLLSFWQNEALMNDSVTRELRALTDNVNRHLDAWLNENTLAVRALSTSNPVIEGLSTLNQFADGESAGQVKSNLAGYLRSVQGKLETILELAVYDNNQQMVASSVPTLEAYDIPVRWPHKSLTAGAVSAPPYWNARYATATLSIIFPVLSYDNVLVGAFAVTLDLGSLRSQLLDAKKFSRGEIFLLDYEGKVLLSSIPGADHEAALDSQQLDELQIRAKDSMTYDGLAYSRSIGLLYMSEKIPVAVLVERDYGDIHAAWTKLRDRFLEFVGILIVIITAVALYMGHTIVTPLKRLIDAVKGIVEGNFETRLQVRQKDEVGQLTIMFNQMTDALRRKHAEIMVANQVMQQKNQLLQKLSVTDSLTGLYNRSKLDAILTEQLARYQRNQRIFCLLMIDVDHFKRINDDLGHIMGDKILIAVATVLLKSIRTIDHAARYGGDEFVVVLTETHADAAVKTAERIRSQVGKICLAFKEHPIKITLSIGIAQCQPEDVTPSDLIARVDAALYEAKKAGRDRIECIGAITQ
ncbi:sensor domain-containing diguanylate cyclase [Nitrosomonas sp. ANs5]|uniref:sensor domain-containing diguanylate cyclase n=1 Tax=Nitrosomonas sp. ANs5 TaxID=3423941 RepID=UPI003D32CBB9